MEKKKELLIRLYLVLAGFIVLAVVMFGRAIQISYVQGDRWRNMAEELYYKLVPVEAERGKILADDGSPMAISLPFFEIRMDTRAQGLEEKTFRNEVAALADKLSQYIITDQSASEIKNWLIKERKAKNGYLLIARNLDYQQMENLKTFPLFKMGQNKGGLIIIKKSRREKPFKTLANRTIGLHRDSFAIGLENTFNQSLSGKDGERMMRKVAAGVYIPMDNVSELEAQKGNDVVTTINIGIQEVAEEALAIALEKHAADKGCAIVMETKTGAIKAIANLGRDAAGLLSEDYNYAVAHSSEPGSTLKLASSIAMLESGQVNLTTAVNLQGGTCYFYDEKMVDSEKPIVDNADLQYSFYKSSNVGISKLCNATFGSYKNEFISYYQKWKLNQRTGVDLGGEPQPVIKDPIKDKAKWYGTTIPWMSIGYEMQLTPLQILNFYNAVANDGRMMKPYIVSQIKNDDLVIKTIKPAVLADSMFSIQALDQAKQLLALVLEKGTASSIKDPAYSIAGKTGTAVSNYFKSIDGSKEYQSSFCGYFPAEAPKYSIIVVIYNPKQGGYYGAAVAAPVFKQIADYCMRLEVPQAIIVNNQPKPSLGIASLPIGNAGNYRDFKNIFEYIGLPFKDKIKSEWIRTLSDEAGVISVPMESISKTVPNLIGMGLRDAMYILDKARIPCQPHGVGKVRSQSIAAGEINYGTTIELYLE